MIKFFAKSVAALFTMLFLFLLLTGILSDIYLMLTVSDEESNSLFMEDTESWDIDQK
jgi:hypothetical protein|tara:strand:- start:508 stop:678 length:171 start_codon:yes stop_codon:yes gene_type:complete